MAPAPGQVAVLVAVLVAERDLAQAAGQARVKVLAQGQVVVPVGEPVAERAQEPGPARVSGQAKERAKAAVRVQATVLAQVQVVAPVVEQVPAPARVPARVPVQAWARELAAEQGRAEGSGKARWRAGWPG